MRALRSILLVAVGLFLLYVKLSSTGTTTPVAPAGTSPAATPPVTTPAGGLAPATVLVPVNGVPDKAIQVLGIVRTTGQPPEGYVGGRTFENRENRLPANGDYREFDVDPHNGQRNAERLIVEWATKKAWYTGDHYRTFIPLP